MRASIASLLCAICTSTLSPQAFAGNLAVGDLPYEQCGGQGYWYRRHPPLVGYAKGERLGAGGDGTCVLGFPDVANILVDGRQIALPKRTGKNGKITYESADRKTKVILVITSSETTCVPGEDKCCGDYTFGTLTVVRGSQKAVLYVVSYEGG